MFFPHQKGSPCVSVDGHDHVHPSAGAFLTCWQCAFARLNPKIGRERLQMNAPKYRCVETSSNPFNNFKHNRSLGVSDLCFFFEPGGRYFEVQPQRALWQRWVCLDNKPMNLTKYNREVSHVGSEAYLSFMFWGQRNTGEICWSRSQDWSRVLYLKSASNLWFSSCFTGEPQRFQLNVPFEMPRGLGQQEPG